MGVTCVGAFEQKGPFSRNFALKNKKFEKKVEETKNGNTPEKQRRRE